jgi:hypothetical protein
VLAIWRPAPSAPAPACFPDFLLLLEEFEFEGLSSSGRILRLHNAILCQSVLHSGENGSAERQ